MSVQTITLSLPNDIYQRFQHVARAVKRPLEDIVFQTIQGNLPPSVEDLPNEWQAELASLQRCNSQALSAIIKEPLSPEQWERHQDLLYQNQTSGLSDSELEELADLRKETDRFVFRRSYALALLKWRGYQVNGFDW